MTQPQDYFQIKGVNTYVNPLAIQDGQLIHSVNMVSSPYLAKSKRPGYSAFLGTPDNAQIQDLFIFPGITNDPTLLNLYRTSGSQIYYSLQGTGAWTVCGNGTITNGSHFGQAIGNAGTVLIGGDGVGSTRHTTDGTSFTNTTLAPVASSFEDYQGRMYAAGTASFNFFSVTNDATNWNTSGTSDSSSLRVPGAGKLNKIFKAGDRLIESKTTGNMFNWDGFSQVDMTTNYGASSPYSVAGIENYRFWINQYGHFGFDGANSQLLSNPVQKIFYNRNNTGIVGTALATIPAGCHFYDYFASIGTVTDDFTGRVINNAILNYNYQKNEYLFWQFANNPTAYLSYNDTNNARQLIFGDNAGQVYKLDPTKTSDNGQPINTEMVYLFTYGMPRWEKKWNKIWLFFNPGCEVNIQYACSNTLTYQHLQWQELNDNSANPNENTDDGVTEYRFPQDSRSRYLFLRIYEADLNSAWSYHGCSISADLMVTLL